MALLRDARAVSDDAQKLRGCLVLFFCYAFLLSSVDMDRVWGRSVLKKCSQTGLLFGRYRIVPFLDLKLR
jgi:hypothetical protein